MHEQKATRIAYGEALAKLGSTNDRVVALDADLSHATMSSIFAKQFPQRFFNMGIAECNMICVAAGMSSSGWIPFCSTFAMFGTGRAYEMIRNAVCYPLMNVKLAFSHAGISIGEDGGSHQAIEDIALMRVLPGMTVLAPCDAYETEAAVLAAVQMNGPVYIRLSRFPTPVYQQAPFSIGKARIMRDGNDIVLYSCGVMVSTALQCADVLAQSGISAMVVNVYSLKPVDRELIMETATRCGCAAPLEDHSIIGGLGDIVADVLCGEAIRLLKIGVNDCFGQSGKSGDLMAAYGLTADQIVPQLLALTACASRKG
ncbi:MAG: transketolase family protein [Clostridia bacterium]|nr:transketolase family protein [Clostridia bacterium]